MMTAVDKADSAQFSESEILDPQGWILMSFLMDPRTGLGRFREFRISNYQLMMQLIDDCTRMTVEEILQTPDVAERVELYNEHSERAVEQIRRCADGRRQPRRARPARRGGHPPDQPLHGLRAVSRRATSRSTCSGASSSRTRSSPPASRSSTARSQTNVGELMLAYGGGGHDAAGTCQVANEDAASVLAELVSKINADG